MLLSKFRVSFPLSVFLAAYVTTAGADLRADLQAAAAARLLSSTQLNQARLQSLEQTRQQSLEEAAAARIDASLATAIRTAIPDTLTELQAIPDALSELEAIPGALTEPDATPGALSELEAISGSLAGLETIPGVQTGLDAIPGGLLGLVPLPVTQTASEPLNAQTSESRILYPEEFRQIGEQGLGDPHNSGVWSMQWWNDKLYIGTVRSWWCYSRAWFTQRAEFLFPYPGESRHQDVCGTDYFDLPLQAEIWQHTPATDELPGEWLRVYQSPGNVEIPGFPGKFTARELGYRGMTVFTEQDGTEALYVGGTTPNILWQPMPAPRILRSTDGINFEALPHEPGTVLGDLADKQASFRTLKTFKDRLYLINGEIQGGGAVLEAEDPTGGNDNFRFVTPEGMRVFDMEVYNGYLYLGTSISGEGYSVVKTLAEGEPPYEFIPVVTNGAHLAVPSNSVVSMHVFNDQLYVGANRPSEIIRINRDDTWAVVVGSPRVTPIGVKLPISNLGPGFDWFLNSHIWRMQVHDGTLYIGTNDEASAWLSRIEIFEESLGDFNLMTLERIQDRAGTDLFATRDGHHFSQITVDGFGDEDLQGIRNFASTPAGLYVGAVNTVSGLRVFNGTPDVPAESDTIRPPQYLDVELVDGKPRLLWDPSPDAVRYHIMRWDWANMLHTAGVTRDNSFTDTGNTPGRRTYYVLAQDINGRFSAPSNITSFPLRTLPPTFSSVRQTLAEWGTPADLIQDFEAARVAVWDGDFPTAIARLGALRQAAGLGIPALESWQNIDLIVLLRKIERRVRLAEQGLIRIIFL